MASVPYPLIACAATSDTLVLASNSSIHVIAGTSSKTIPIPSSSASTFIRQLAISPDSKYAVTVSNDKGLRVYDLVEKTHLSTRYLTKKPSMISFTDKSNTDTGLDIIVSDKVGDCYLYPLVPRDISSDKVKIMDIQADPTLNPEATYLLGHVSVLTSHILTEDKEGKWLISADRDEHIRVTRYPNTYVIDKYMFGTDGFVSSIHIPTGHPELLLSAGGEGVMRLCIWKTWRQVGSIDIADTVLPYRRARSSLRKDKRKLKGKKAPVPESEGEAEGSGEKDFYHVPEGWMLPSGQGILIRNITTLQVEDATIVLFYSEGYVLLPTHL
jgi:tRNA (guanine-N(7)-)-methyltransferase subunit TRM82